MATTDTAAAIREINALHCDADTVAQLLSAIENRYGEWLKAQDLIGRERTGYGKLIDAFDELSEFADWEAGAARAASRQPLSSIERAVLGERA